MEDLTLLKELLANGLFGGGVAAAILGVRYLILYLNTRRQTEPDLIRARTEAETLLSEQQARKIQEFIDTLVAQIKALQAEMQAERQGRHEDVTRLRAERGRLEEAVRDREEALRDRDDEIARLRRAVDRLTGNGGPPVSGAGGPPRTPPEGG